MKWLTCRDRPVHTPHMNTTTAALHFHLYTTNRDGELQLVMTAHSNEERENVTGPLNITHAEACEEQH